MRRRSAISVLLVCCLGGCEGSKEGGSGATATASASAASSASASAKGPAGLSGLSATLNGEPLPLKTALAHSRGGAGLELEISTATPDCDDLKGRGRMLAKGEQHFSVSIAPLLKADGKEVWGIGKIYYDSHTQQGGDLGEVTITSASPAEGVEGTIAFELDLKANDFMNKPARKLVVKGPFVARGCGVLEPQDAPAKRPQGDLTLKVAGKSFDVTAATVKPTDFPSEGHELLLSTAPASCETSPSDADLTLKLNLGEGGRATYAYMAGKLLSSQLNATPAKDGPTVTAKPAGPLEGEGEVTLALSGDLKILDYPVSLEGEVTALRCPE